MTAREARNIAMKIEAKNDFITMTLDEIYENITADAQDKKMASVFYGIIPDDLYKRFKDDGFEIRIFKNDPQPMTEISWYDQPK